MTGRGWLFDLYPSAKGMQLWFLHEAGGHLTVWEPYAPTFYVRGPKDCLKRALRTLRVPLSAAPTERLELWSGKTVPVVEIRILHPLRYARVVSALGGWEDSALELFTCDISLPQRYCYDRGVFPLAFCAWEASEEGELQALDVLDDPWAVDYRLPAFRVMTVKVEGELVNPRHGYCGRLEVSYDGETRALEGDDPPQLLETFATTLGQHDPDVVLTHWGDAWLLPTLTALARRYGVMLPWHRDPQASLRGRKAHSYVSYGRIVRREASQVLAGRWHLDAENTFLLTETGFEGLVELARLCRMPVQRLARTSTGTAISSLQVLQAYQDGVLIPWHKQQAEGFKTAEALLTTDKGGLVFVPKPGVYGEVAELDFASLYPTIMAKFNVSPETLDCPCCPRHQVPEIGRHTCTRRKGLVPRVLEPILAKRAKLKALRQAARDAETRQRYDRRQNALKWILVTSFGYLGYKNFVFGRIEAHEAVTAYSRDILLRAKELAEDAGFSLVHAIVDSIWVHKPGLTPAAVRVLAQSISQQTGIPIAVEGIYRWLIFPPSRSHPSLAVPNRFFGVFQDGAMKVRGLELRRHDTPLFIAKAQQALLDVLAKARMPEELAQRGAEAYTVLAAYVAELLHGQVPLHELAITKQVSQDPEAYVRPGDTAIAAQHLLARGIRVAPGEIVQFLITSARDSDPACRVRPLAWGAPLEGYDREKYLELLLRAAETVLGILGYDHTSLTDALARS